LKSLLSKAVDNPDITLACLGCALAIPLTIYLQLTLRSPVYVTIGIIAFLSCLAYLIIRRRSLPSIQAQVEATPHMYLLLNIAFFSLLTYSLVVLHLRPELYTRPLTYFIATAAMVGVLAIEVLFLPPRKSATYFALFKIILIGLSLAWSQLLIYPSTVGIDPWYHQWFTASILDTGHIPDGYGYSKLPSMHLVIGATSLVTGLGYKMATMLSVCLLQVICNTLFIFLLGKFIHSAKAGLLAALLLGVANWHVHFSYWTIPNTMALIFIPIILYLMFKLRKEKPKTSLSLVALFMIVAILTHPIGTVSLAMLLFLIWLGFKIYKWLRYQVAVTARVFLIAFILFTVATLSYWTFASGHMTTLTNLVSTGFSGEFFGIPPPEEAVSVPEVVSPPGEEVLPPGEVVSPPEEVVPMSTAVAQYRDSLPAERLFNNLGFFLFCAFVFIGAFAMLSRGMRNRYGFALVIAGLIVLALDFFGIVTHRGFLTDRWSYFSQILLAIPVGIALLWLGSLSVRKIVGACLIGIIAFALSFLMVVSPQANLDNRTFAPNTIVRYAFTQSELQAAETVSNIWSGKIGSDWYLQDMGFLPVLPNEIEDIGEQIYRRDFSQLGGTFILLREEIVQHPFQIASQSLYRLDYDPGQTLAEQGFSKVYDCGSVSGFIK
jgi:hypothetical protein